MNTCMVAYTFYESDPRVKRYAETLADQGHNVDVISLRRKGTCTYEEINGVGIHKIQERVLNEKHSLTYLYKLLKFFILSLFFLCRKSLEKPYDFIHVHSVPDFEVFATLLPKLAGTKIILDIHDIVPEFYASKFSASKKSVMFRILALVEKISIAFSDHVIISNDIWYHTLLSRSVRQDKCTVIINYPDTSIFFRRNPLPQREKIILLYPGGFHWHQGLDIAIKAFSMIREKAPEAYFYIYGDGPEKNALKSLIGELGMEKRVVLKKEVAIDDVAHLMSNADIGVVPKRNDPFGGEAFSTKILEFMCMGTPVIVSRTKIDDFYFNESIVKFFDPENEEDLASAMLLLIENKEMRKRLSENAYEFIQENNWEVKKHIYLNLVDSLIASKKAYRLK